MFKISRSLAVDPYLIQDLLPCFNHIDRNEVAKNIIRGDMSFTFWGGDKVLAVIGATQVNEYTLYGWSILGEGIKQYRYSFARRMKDFINDVIRVKKLKRFFTTINSDNNVAIRQNEWMGLEFEGVMRSAGSNGQNLVLMAKVV